MLYETFNSIRESFGEDYFISRVTDEIVQSLNQICNINLTYFKFADKLEIYIDLISRL